MLYKAALKDTATSGESTEEEGPAAPTASSAPHPYHMALGVLSIQKVLVGCFHNHAFGNVMFISYSI